MANIWYLILIPLVAGAVVFLLTGNLPVKYNTHATIFTGITSNVGIENLGNSRVDYFATQNAYNNMLSILNSENVLRETSLRLLSLHLSQTEPKKDILSASSFDALQEIVPEEIRDLVVINDLEQTYTNISKAVVQDSDNFLYGLLYYDHPHYSMKALSKVKSVHISSSDLIKISYESSDAGVCYQTVKILLRVFIEKYNGLKRSQTGSAVAYFEAQLKKSALKLKKAEDQLLYFNTQNSIINYYEQTKHVSSQQEKIEVRLQEIHMENEAAKAVLKRLEQETEKRFKVNLNSDELLSTRQNLATINDKLMFLELQNSADSSVQKQFLKTKKTQLELQLQNKLDSLYAYKNRSDGIEINSILKEWLAAATNYESSRSRLKAIKARKTEFMSLYTQYAPLGAKLKRIEREIKVNEEEYLEILHHLGLARLKQQNADIQADMKVLDAAKFPIKASASKRKIFVVIAALFSQLFFVFGLFLLEILDQRVKNSARLKRWAHMDTISGFCAEEYPELNIEQLNKKAASYIFEKMAFEKMNIPTRSLRVMFISNWHGDGKSYVIQQLERFMIEKSIPFANANNISSSPQVDYQLIEHSSLSEGIANPKVVIDTDLCFLVVDASATWKTADAFFLERLRTLRPDGFVAVLTKAQPDDLESIYGNMPKKRSKLRRYIKNQTLKRFL